LDNSQVTLGRTVNIVSGSGRPAEFFAYGDFRLPAKRGRLLNTPEKRIPEASTFGAAARVGDAAFVSPAVVTLLASENGVARAHSSAEKVARSRDLKETQAPISVVVCVRMRRPHLCATLGRANVFSGG
jgi:hypothetical protein